MPFFLNDLGVRKKDHEYIYNLKISTSSNNSYIIYCPVIYQNDPSSLVFSDKDIIGSHSIESITTDHGYAIRIEGSGPFSIDFQYSGLEHFSWNYRIFNYNDSASYRERAEYLIYYNSTNNYSAHMKIEFDYNGLGKARHLNLEGDLLLNGWQVVTGEEMHEAIA
jgi:hypothetical protein